MLWFLLAWLGLAHAEGCVSSEVGTHESLQEALDDGAKEVGVTCDLVEIALVLEDDDDVEDDVTISVESGVVLRLCGRAGVLFGDPALDVDHHDLTIDAAAGEVVIESPYASVRVGRQGSLELIDVQVTGKVEGACGDVDEPGLPGQDNRPLVSLLEVRGELTLMGGQVQHGVASEGGGVWVDGSLTAVGTRFSANRGSPGEAPSFWAAASCSLRTSNSPTTWRDPSAEGPSSCGPWGTT